MYKYDSLLADLLTGEDMFDAKLRAAFDMGVRYGTVSDRASVQLSARIDQTTRLLIAVMRSQDIGLEQALADFNIPKKERDTYRRIIMKRIPKQRGSHQEKGSL